MNSLSSTEAHQIASGNHPDPFAVLGPHQDAASVTIRVFWPGVDSITVAVSPKPGSPIPETPIQGLSIQGSPTSLKPTLVELAVMKKRNDVAGLFEAQISSTEFLPNYQLRLTRNGHTWIAEDPYRFGPVLGELDEHLIGEGSHLQLWEVLGAHLLRHEGVEGTHFALWAPNAKRVSVVGDFNSWNGSQHVMRSRGQSGVWEIFVPGVEAGAAYKYELLNAEGSLLPQKADPFGFGAEHPPKTASVVRAIEAFDWSDAEWMSRRAARQSIDAPISIYEVHLGSWRRVHDDNNRPLSYTELATDLVSYAKDLGFTHIELLPITEFPFDGSWGYQPVGLFAPTIRHGTPEECRAFVDACHNAGLGLILDWVPGHFPEDLHGLGRLDGTSLYEHADAREGWHPDWKTYVYNYGRREVSNYLVSNALFWLQEYHLDALRVDAVASMLYRDYSRKDGEWIPNAHGGRENLEAIAFLQKVNIESYGSIAGVMTIAEESTAFPGVSSPVDAGGLGFGFKWNMGWMNDTLSYMSKDPVHRKFHHHQMSFGLHYAFTENFVLPLSHDEVVHGKGSMLQKMPGSWEEKFASLRAYYGFMWGHPGKKLLFMGCEFAQINEWNHQQSLDWHLLDQPLHHGIQALVRDLNRLYVDTPALHELDCSSDGFDWIEEYGADESVYAWIRSGKDGAKPALVVCNFTPLERTAWRAGVPLPGRWAECINTNAHSYGGEGKGNLGGLDSEQVPSHHQPHSLVLTLPALTTLVFVLSD